MKGYIKLSPGWQKQPTARDVTFVVALTVIGSVIVGVALGLLTYRIFY